MERLTTKTDKKVMRKGKHHRPPEERTWPANSHTWKEHYASSAMSGSTAETKQAGKHYVRLYWWPCDYKEWKICRADHRRHMAKSDSQFEGYI
eukprot:scaffold306396_cov52-Prasinocladus_malaysianus.AAC.1